MDWMTAFPDFRIADMPDMTPLKGFEDISWPHDVCPRFARGDVSVWIDWADPAMREFPESRRFMVTHGDDGHTLIETDDWAEAVRVALAAGEAQGCA